MDVVFVNFEETEFFKKLLAIESSGLVASKYLNMIKILRNFNFSLVWSRASVGENFPGIK
jgi:hypothetical protein